MTDHTDLDSREALAERLVDDTTHALAMLSVYLGLELGLYQALNGRCATAFGGQGSGP